MQNIAFEAFPTSVGPVTIVYTSRWIKRSDTVTVPGHLWIEVRGNAPDLESALSPFANAGLAGISIIATAANAGIPEPELEVAFESTPGSRERDFFQSYIPPEANVAHTGRMVDIEAALALVKALQLHPDSERLVRATTQYNLALQNWKFGHSSIALAHLWMAVEALTKVAFRTECKKRGVATGKQLADALSVEVKNLDPTLRQDIILKGDAACYREGKEASDGLEHGYLGFDKVFELSQNVRKRMASYVRASIFDLAALEDKYKAILLSERFSSPLGAWRLAKYLRGTLKSSGEDFALPGSEYPFIRWRPEIVKCELKEDGTLDTTINENLSPELATGVTFTPKSMEVWQPD